MKLSNMASVLRAAGISVVEVDGWANRGYAGEDLTEYRGNLWHHTATNRAAFANANAPTLSMCINGRPDLPGPLCNAVVGRDATVYLIAAGKANHAGRGSAAGIPRDAGNYYLFGWEMESSGIAPWDWTPEQLAVVPRIAAATERAYKIELELGHLEYSSEGKIDPAGWPGGMDGMRATINAVLNGSLSYTSESITPVQEDDMPSLDEIAAAVWSYRNKDLEQRDTYQILRDIPGDTLTHQVPHKDPITAKDDGQTTSLATLAGYGDFQHTATRETLLAAVRGIVDAVKAAPGPDAAKAAEEAYNAFAAKLQGIKVTVTAGGQ